MHYVELHNHLYGSITAEKLFEIGKNNPNPRWNIFTDLHNKLYHEEIRIDSFFEDYRDITRFRKLYLFNRQAPFIQFQSKFNLIIALSRFDEEEIRDVAKQIVAEYFIQGVEYAEYRVMYSPMADQTAYEKKTIAACEGLRKGEQESGNKIKARLVVSLHRDGNYLQQYEWLKKLMKENDVVKEYLVGIDFCAIEEGFPPSDKKLFFQKILSDNKEYPDSALAILYHVGESYADKTPKSAVRWVGESALGGAHRLGHCIALGIEPEGFADKQISETIGERLDQIEFEILNYEKLRSYGATREYSKLRKEKELLISKDRRERISFQMNKRYIEELNSFQEFVIYIIREKTKSVIECCPTSNLYIGMLQDIRKHPIRRFIDRELRVTIGSDDPGIFETTLMREYELAATAGLSSEELSKIQELSYSYASEKLSGRKP